MGERIVEETPMVVTGLLGGVERMIRSTVLLVDGA